MDKELNNCLLEANLPELAEFRNLSIRNRPSIQRVGGTVDRLAW